MKALLKKEFLSMRSFLLVLLILVVICFITVFFVDEPGFYYGYVAGITIFVASAMCFSSFTYDSISKWDSFVLTLPVSRKKILSVKYIFSILLVSIALGIALLASVIYAAAVGSSIPGEIVLSTFGLYAYAMIFISLMVPISYKFGAERSRIIVMLILIVPVLLIAFQYDKLNIGQGLIDLLPVLLPIVAGCALVLSYFISYRIYRAKDV